MFDFIQYELEGKKRNTAFFTAIIEMNGIGGTGWWVWEEYDKVYLVHDGKLHSSKQNLDLLFSLSNLKKTKTKQIKFSKTVHKWKTIMRSRMNNKSGWLSNVEEYCRELSICKDMGNECYNAGFFNAAKGMYASFFVGPSSKCYHKLMEFDYTWNAIKGMKDVETAKLCNNISLCLLKQKEMNSAVGWCEKALYFNPNYEKVNKRIIQLTK